MSKKGTWEGKPRYRWVLMDGGVRHRVTCKQLGLPVQLWTKEGSTKAAHVHFEKLAEQRVVERYANHPELNLERKALSVLEPGEVDDLKRHMDEVAERPPGATRTMTSVVRERKRRLEDLLEVDLSHVADDILEYLLVQEPLRETIKERVRNSPPVDPDRTIGHCVEVYLRALRQSEAKDLRHATTIEFHRYNLKRFVGVVGAARAVDDIGFDLWHEFGEHCESCGGGGWGAKTAKSTLGTAKAFVRWLYKSERVEKLPRNFDDYRVTLTTKEPKVFPKAELKKILSEADDELLLMVLLALNTGANQIDIAQLEYARDENSTGLWGNVIRRKRVKTEHHEGVPVVKYVLWPETVRLLERFKQAGAVVLRNSDGGLWVSRVRGADDKLKNNDALGLRFSRYLTDIGLKERGYSFKTLRATAASLVGNSDYRAFGPLFLGQAPDGVYEKHYLQEDCRLLSEAVEWLRTQIVPLTKRAKKR